MNPINDYNKNKGTTVPNKYSQYWHMTPDANISIDGQYKLKPGETIAWKHDNFADVDKQIKNTHYVPGTGTGALKSNFNGKANIQVVPVDIASVEPQLNYGYYTDGRSAPYGRFDKYAFGTTKVDSILFPTRVNEVYSIVPTPVEVTGLKESYVSIDGKPAVKEDGAVSAFTANIKAEEGKIKEDYTIHYMLLHESDKRIGTELGFGDYSTNADLAYYEVDTTGLRPTPRRLILQNGTHLKDTSMVYFTI